MSAVANFAGTPRRQSAYLQAGDPSRSGGATLPAGAQLVFLRGAAGSRIERVEFDGAGPTTQTLVRLWVHDGTNLRSCYEMPVPASAPANGMAAWRAALDSSVFPDTFPILLPAAAGAALYATVQDTQVALAEAQASVAASQSVAANAYAVLTTAGTANGLVASATAGAAGFKTLVANAQPAGNPFQLSITSAANNATVSYTVRGVNALGAVVSESITGPNAATVYSANIYQAITSVFVSGAESGASTLGWPSYAALGFPAKLTIASSASLAGSNFTLTGLDASNTLVTETLAGPAAGAVVTSANSYRLVTSARASALANPTLIGNAIALGGIAVHAQGGDF